MIINGSLNWFVRMCDEYKTLFVLVGSLYFRSSVKVFAWFTVDRYNFIGWRTTFRNLINV